MATNAISSNISTLLNPFGPQWPDASPSTEEVKSVGEQVQDALFGHKKPTPLDEDDFPELKKILKKLNGYKRKFMMLAGDEALEYHLQLAKGTIAMIDGRGTIYMGKNFLQQFKDKLEVPIGALAHEVGHRPQRWAEYKTEKRLTTAELQSLCRYEETRADLFAGRGMAEVGLSIEPMIQFLEDVEEGPHPEYFPASMRAEVIREGYSEQKKRGATRRRLWPELDQRFSAKYHIGEF